jgi:hypothetical protein
VPERGGHEPVREDLFVAALATAGVGGVAFEVVQRSNDGGVVGLADLPGDVWVGERPQERHRICRPSRYAASASWQGLFGCAGAAWSGQRSA